MWWKGSLGNASGTLRALAAGGLLDVEPEEALHLMNNDAANRVVCSVFNELQDREFTNNLDTRTPKGCVPMKNGMFDAGGDVFRRFVP